jgi:hypothetical protein
VSVSPVRSCSLTPKTFFQVLCNEISISEELCPRKKVLFVGRVVFRFPRCVYRASILFLSGNFFSCQLPVYRLFNLLMFSRFLGIQIVRQSIIIKRSRWFDKKAKFESDTARRHVCCYGAVQQIKKMILFTEGELRDNKN